MWGHLFSDNLGFLCLLFLKLVSLLLGLSLWGCGGGEGGGVGVKRVVVAEGLTGTLVHTCLSSRIRRDSSMGLGEGHSYSHTDTMGQRNYLTSSLSTSVSCRYLFLEGEDNFWCICTALPGERGSSGSMSGGDSQRSAQDTDCR